MGQHQEADRPEEKNWHFFLTEYTDYAMAETPIDNTEALARRAATLRALGIGYVPSLKPRSTPENFRMSSGFLHGPL